MLQKGDILFYKGISPISNIIKQQTNSPYSHTAMILDDIHIMETDVFFPTKINHIHYKRSMYDIYKIKYLSDEKLIKIKEFFSIHMNANYDWGEIFSFVWNKYLGLDVVNNPNLFICSSLIFEACKYAGIYLFDENEVGIITPEVLSKSDLLVKI